MKTSTKISMCLLLIAAAAYPKIADEARALRAFCATHNPVVMALDKASEVIPK